jgi:hypothetical protein
VGPEHRARSAAAGRSGPRIAQPNGPSHPTTRDPARATTASERTLARRPSHHPPVRTLAFWASPDTLGGRSSRHSLPPARVTPCRGPRCRHRARSSSRPDALMPRVAVARLRRGEARVGYRAGDGSSQPRTKRRTCRHRATPKPSLSSENDHSPSARAATQTREGPGPVAAPLGHGNAAANPADSSRSKARP